MFFKINHRPGGISKGKIFLAILAGLLFFQNCKSPYDPKIKPSENDYLVVEGFINGNGTTWISLTRTRNIYSYDSATRKYETNATVVVEDDHNNTYSLYPLNAGRYEGNFFLNPSVKYRIHIKTSDNKEYVSDFVPYKQSPPIDDMPWEIKDNGVQIYVNTHNAQNDSRYYRWEFSETWEYHSRYYAGVEYDKSNNVVLIPNVKQMWTCWNSKNSTNIFLGSSAKLKDDIIYQAPIEYIPYHDKRISVLFSIQATQYVLDTLAYNYWTAMKSNTENVGSIFDPQPNQTRGNVHSVTNPDEIVVGYISAGSMQQYRLFISNSSLPSGWNSYGNCEEYEVPPIPDSIRYYFQGGGGLLPYDADLTNDGKIKGYLSATSTCVDCTLTGTNVKPSFWP